MNNCGNTGNPCYSLEEANLLDKRLRLDDPRIMAWFQNFDDLKTFSDGEHSAALRGKIEWLDESESLELIAKNFILGGYLNRVLLAAHVHIININGLLVDRRGRASQAKIENMKARIERLKLDGESIDAISPAELKRYCKPTRREEVEYDLYKDTLLMIISSLAELTDLPFTSIELEQTLVRLWLAPENDLEHEKIDYYLGLLDGPRKVHKQVEGKPKKVQSGTNDGVNIPRDDMTIEDIWDKLKVEKTVGLPRTCKALDSYLRRENITPEHRGTTGPNNPSRFSFVKVKDSLLKRVVK